MEARWQIEARGACPGDQPRLAVAGRESQPELSTSIRGHGSSTPEVPMIPQLKRHEIQVLLKAGHRQERSRRPSGGRASPSRFEP